MPAGQCLVALIFVSLVLRGFQLLTDRAAIKGWNDVALRHVVENERLSLASCQNVAGDWAVLILPEIQEDFAQLIRYRHKPFTLCRLCASRNPVSNSAPHRDMLLRPAHSSQRKPRASDGLTPLKAMIATAARSAGIPLRALRIPCTSSKVAATVRFGAEADSGMRARDAGL